MKRYRHPWIFSAVTLSLSYLAFMVPATATTAMGQPGSHTATSSQADPVEIEEMEIETTNGEIPAERAELPGENQISPPAQVRAASGSNAVPIEVVKVLSILSDTVIEAERDHAKDIIIQMFHTNPIYESAVLKLSDGSRKIVPIQYDYGSLDIAQTGLTMLSGTITPPAGFHISPELAGVEFPVFLYDPAAPCEMPASFLEPLSRTQIVLPEGAGFENLIETRELDDTLYYKLEGGFTWSTAISWDFDEVSFGTPGIYKAIARPKLLEGILLPNKLPELVCNIVIQEDGPLRLGPPEFTGLYMTAEWTKETPDPDRFRCFYAIGDGEWQEDIEQELVSIPRFAPHYLQVFYYEDVFFETPYSFQISYDGEYSNILKVYFSEGQIHYNFYDGDRDGGDREDQTPPDVSQTVPPPTNPPDPKPEDLVPTETLPNATFDHDSGDHNFSLEGQDSDRSISSNYSTSGPGFKRNGAEGQEEPAINQTIDTENALPSSVVPAKEQGVEIPPSLSRPQTPKPTDDTAAQEEDTMDYVVLSGLRIKRQMEQNPGRPLIVEKHHIRLEIPSDAVFFNHMEDTSLLRVELMRSDQTIVLDLSLDGAPLSNLPDLTLTVPWQTADPDLGLQLVDQAGTVLSRTAVSNGYAVFTIRQTGTLRIEEAKEAADTAAGVASSDAVPVTSRPDVPDNSHQTSRTPQRWILISFILLALLRVSMWTWRHFQEQVRQKGGSSS